jgi:quercetin dioxygenase-like cupin family protein
VTKHLFTVAGGATVDLDDLADQLRAQIDELPPDVPQLKATHLDGQTSVQEYLVVVRGHENAHIHPDGDLIISVLDGGGHVQLSSNKVELSAGSVIVVPKGVCHAYYNLARHDSVILATFSPINTTADCPIQAPDPSIAP